MSEGLTVTPAARITARLDRLPMTRHIWVLVLLISLGGWFDVYSLFLTGYIAPGLFADKIFTPTTKGFFDVNGLAFFIAALFAGLFLGTLFLTRFADRSGRRTVFTYSLVWYCVCSTIMAFQSTAEWVSFFRFLSGLGLGVELVTIDTYISELVPKRARGVSFAVQQSIGFIAVPAVCFLAWAWVPLSFAGLSGWRWVVLFDAVGAALVWLARFGLPESPRWLAQHGRIEEAECVMVAIETKVAQQSGAPLPEPDPPSLELSRKGELREAFGPQYRARTIMLSIVNFFQTIGFYGFANWIPTLLIAKGITVTKSLEYTFIIAFAYPLFPLLGSWFADKIERKWQVCLSCTGIALFGIAFSTQTSPAILIVIGAFQTMANAWLSYSSHNYMTELFPTRIRASAVGFVYSWSRFSTIFTGFIIAWLLGQWGVPAVFLFVAGAMGIVVLGVAVWGPRTNNLALEDISH
jgi:MFS transporter, putative metabolite:H+ symporter